MKKLVGTVLVPNFYSLIAVSEFPGEASVGTAVLLGTSAGRRHPVPDLIATVPPGLSPWKPSPCEN